MTEEVLLRKLAKKLHWNYLEDVKALDFREIYEPLMISELRHYGIMPLVKGHCVIGYACCDPSIVPDKYSGVVNQTKVISSWKAISKALDESGKLSLCVKDKDFSKAKEVVSLLFAEVDRFNGKSLIICFNEKETVYKFKSGDGQIGQGKIDKRVREVLQSYLITISHTKSKEVIISAENKYKLICNGNNFILVKSSQKSEPHFPIQEISEQKSRFNAIILDEDVFFAETLEGYLNELGISSKIVSTLCNFLEIITDETKVIFCSSEFLGGSWRNIIKMLKKNNNFSNSSFILLTPHKAKDLQLDAITSGASFCISKRERTAILKNCIIKIIKQTKEKLSETENSNLLECYNC